MDSFSGHTTPQDTVTEQVSDIYVDAYDDGGGG